MVKLTAELILKSEPYFSPLKEREMDLRGHNIPAIENLGVTKNQLDSIDLSDNAITSLSNLPSLPRLKHIILAQNPIIVISPNLARAVPNLESLVLSATQLKELKDLDPLARFTQLEFLSVRDSPVARQPHYRLWLIYRCKKLRLLDFEKVKDRERKQAKQLFQTAEGQPTALALSISSTATANGSTVPAIQSKTFEPGQQPEAATSAYANEDKGRLLTAEDKKRIRAAIEAATSVEEVRKLQRSLEDGFLPTANDLKALRGTKSKGASSMEVD